MSGCVQRPCRLAMIGGQKLTLEADDFKGMGKNQLKTNVACRLFFCLHWWRLIQWDSRICSRPQVSIRLLMNRFLDCAYTVSRTARLIGHNPAQEHLCCNHQDVRSHLWQTSLSLFHLVLSLKTHNSNNQTKRKIHSNKEHTYQLARTLCPHAG